MSRSRRLNTVGITLIVCGACVEVAYLRGCLLLLFAAFLDSGIRKLVGTTLCIGSSSHFRWLHFRCTAGISFLYRVAQKMTVLSFFVRVRMDRLTCWPS